MTRKKRYKTPYQKSMFKAQRAFSDMIRLRDADWDGTVKCCTCGFSYYWRDVDAGHYIPAHIEELRFNEMNVHGQCRRCNCFLGGNIEAYEGFIINNYGYHINHLFKQKKIERNLMLRSASDLLELAKVFKKKANKIAQEKGLSYN